MRITVELDEKDLASVHRATGIRKRSPAVRQAIADYVKDLEKKPFSPVRDGRQVGLCDEQRGTRSPGHP